MISLVRIKGLSSFINSSKELKDSIITVSTDSRSYKGESLFVAISGIKFNAFEFIEAIVAQGCKNIVFTANKVNNDLFESFKDQYTEVNFISVTDSVLFLQELAHEISVEFQKKGKLICISGSNGKTTTKEMLFTVLKNLNKKVICTQKNNNNHIGVPLTIFQISAETEYAIVELGSNHPGEIKTLCDIADPHIGVTTNIGLTHMEFFSTLENVFLEEGYLYHHINGVKEKKSFFLNLDDSYLSKLTNCSHCVTFGGKGSGADFEFCVSESGAQIYIEGMSYEVTNTSITGQHNFYNLCVSIAMAHQVSKESIEKILQAAKEFAPTQNRSQWTSLEKSQIFLDAYNANPSSMRAALRGFKGYLSKEISNGAKTCVIVGDMYELGENSSIYHQELGNEIAKMGFDKVIFVGKFAKDYQQNFNNSESFACVQDFKKSFLTDVINQFDYIFIKGSRSLQLESLIDITYA